MTSIAAANNTFRVDLREFRFLLFEQLRLDELLGAEPFAAWGRDEVELILTEVARFATDVSGPLNSVGDRAGCLLEGGRVRTPPGFREAWARLYEAGWKSLAAPEAYGGQEAPYALHCFVEEMLAGSNVAFAVYAGLTYGVAELINVLGTREQKARMLDALYRGRWAGTMCLTEPHAGSDVGSVRTSARRRSDGRYDIRGTKMFITAGEHDMAENIVHAVLARVEGAPPGTKGLSLFLVPKRRVNADGTLGEPNDVVVAGLEHKMGMNGSATCLLSFGENDACIGELVGTVENVGMSQMFRMMNGARIFVGIQGLGVASTAYLNALEYARGRKQGPHISRFKDPTAPRVPIIQHPDVRRMLLDMKARVEGIRALVYKLALHQDRARALAGRDDAQAAYHYGQVDLLVPLVKAYSSDQAFRVCETAIQVYGGVGYIRDYPVEQYARDSKIFSIYEGTNHIQAMDLVGRKLGQAGGTNVRAFLGDVGAFVAAASNHPVLGTDVRTLGKVSEAIGGTLLKLVSWSQAGQLAPVDLNANRVLEMLAETAVGWMLLDGARVAHAAAAKLPPEHPDQAFYAGKQAAASYYARAVLPSVITKAKAIQAGDDTPLVIPDEGFATV